MAKEDVMDGLKEALKILMDKVPVIDAWEAIKAVQAALVWAKEVAAE